MCAQGAGERPRNPIRPVRPNRRSDGKHGCLRSGCSCQSTRWQLGTHLAPRCQIAEAAGFPLGSQIDTCLHALAIVPPMAMPASPIDMQSRLDWRRLHGSGLNVSECLRWQSAVVPLPAKTASASCMCLLPRPHPPVRRQRHPEKSRRPSRCIESFALRTGPLLSEPLRA